MVILKGMRFPIDVILVCIWYAAYPLRYRHLEEMMQERGVSVDHSSINRWAIRFLPLIEKMARKHERPVGGSWRMDETYIKVKGVWKYLYRAVDKQGKTVDFLLTAKRDMAAAKRFFDKAMGANGAPEKVAMDKSGANKAAFDAINAGRSLPTLVRQVKYLNNIIEQDHRAIKRVTRPMLNFKSFRAAGSVLAGIELVHLIRKGQFAIDGTDAMSFADQFARWQKWSVQFERDIALPGKFRRLINNATEPKPTCRMPTAPKKINATEPSLMRQNRRYRPVLRRRHLTKNSFLAFCWILIHCMSSLRPRMD